MSASPTKRRSRRRALLPVLLSLSALLPAACGGGGRVDSAGLAEGGSPEARFLRASQQYFRGSLSAAEDVFTDLAAGSPESPLTEDAVLALRRIERERSGIGFPDSTEVGPADAPTVLPPVALVGRPLVSDRMARLASEFQAAGCTPVTMTDPGAPEGTLVLYPEGMESEAGLVADSLEAWLSSPMSISIQPGGSVIATIAPGHQGIVIVVGTDAVVGRTGSSR